MRVAIIRSSLLKGSGQVTHISEIAKRMIKLGYSVTVFSQKVEQTLDGVPTVELRFGGHGIPWLRGFVFPSRCVSSLRKFDLVHTQYHPGVYVGTVAKRSLQKKHVFTFHGFAPIRLWRDHRQQLKMIDHRVGTFLALQAGFDRIIAVSHFLKNELIKHYLIPSSFIKVVYNGIDTERFNPEVRGDIFRRKYNLQNNPVVLYLGRLAPYKGVQFLINSIPLVLDEVPDAKFMIAGSIRYDALDFYRIINRLGIQRSVIFTGFVPENLVSQLYACCDVFCYPSLWEGFGLTPAEAEASGKPVVAFDTCAIPEVVKDGFTGRLVEPKNYVQLAEAIISLLTNEKLRQRLGREARRRVITLFSWKKAAQQTLQLYEEVLE